MLLLVKRRFSLVVSGFIIGLLIPVLGLSAPPPPVSHFPLGERLHYVVSFRGLITSMIWLDGANLSLTISPKIRHFAGQPAYRFTMETSSEHYKKTELLYKLRFRHQTYLSADLKRTLFSESTQKAGKVTHNILWFDWDRQKATLFKKRKQTQADDALELEKELEMALEEETDGKLAGELKTGLAGKSQRSDGRDNVPKYLRDSYPLLPDGSSYFISDKYGEIKLQASAFDRLSALYLFRNIDKAIGSKMVIPVCNGKSMYQYNVSVVAHERIKVFSRHWDTYKLEIKSTNLKGIHKKSRRSNFFLWISAKTRIPVRVRSTVIFGTFGIDLRKREMD